MSQVEDYNNSFSLLEEMEDKLSTCTNKSEIRLLEQKIHALEGKYKIGTQDPKHAERVKLDKIEMKARSVHRRFFEGFLKDKEFIFRMKNRTIYYTMLFDSHEKWMKARSGKWKYDGNPNLVPDYWVCRSIASGGLNRPDFEFCKFKPCECRWALIRSRKVNKYHKDVKSSWFTFNSQIRDRVETYIY